MRNGQPTTDNGRAARTADSSGRCVKLGLTYLAMSLALIAVPRGVFAGCSCGCGSGTCNQYTCQLNCAELNCQGYGCFGEGCYCRCPGEGAVGCADYDGQSGCGGLSTCGCGSVCPISSPPCDGSAVSCATNNPPGCSGAGCGCDPICPDGIKQCGGVGCSFGGSGCGGTGCAVSPCAQRCKNATPLCTGTGCVGYFGGTCFAYGCAAACSGGCKKAAPLCSGSDFCFVIGCGIPTCTCGLMCKSAPSRPCGTPVNCAQQKCQAGDCDCGTVCTATPLCGGHPMACATHGCNTGGGCSCGSHCPHHMPCNAKSAATCGNCGQGISGACPKCPKFCPKGLSPCNGDPPCRPSPVAECYPTDRGCQSSGSWACYGSKCCGGSCSHGQGWCGRTNCSPSLCRCWGTAGCNCN